MIWRKLGKSRGKILLIEDERDFARVLQVRLKSDGYDVILASDSVQGFKMAQKEKPDLVILDVMIPGGGGFAVAKQLKLSAETSRIPFIFLTGIPGTEESAYRAGAFHHFLKPYKPNELLDVIKNALELRDSSPRPSMQSI